MLVYVETLKVAFGLNLSRGATALERAEDAAGDEGEAEEGEHDDGADAQLRDRVHWLMLFPSPQPSFLILLLPELDGCQLFCMASPDS